MSEHEGNTFMADETEQPLEVVTESSEETLTRDELETRLSELKSSLTRLMMRKTLGQAGETFDTEKKEIRSEIAKHFLALERLNKSEGEQNE